MGYSIVLDDRTAADKCCYKSARALQQPLPAGRQVLHHARCVDRQRVVVDNVDVGTLTNRLPADMVVMKKEHREKAEKIWGLTPGTIPAKPTYHATDMWRDTWVWPESSRAPGPRSSPPCRGGAS